MSDQHQTDPGAACMLAWKGGDEAAFDELVERYSGQVYALLTRFLGRREGREDLVQEVFLRVIKAAERYEPSARFSTWLYRIVFNLCVNETERSSRRDTLSLESDDSDDPGLEPADERESEPTEQLERVDAVLAVRKAIQSLPDKQRMALILAKYHDVPYVEIGRILETSEKAVKSLIHRARETLRERLAPFLQGESV